MLSENLQKVGLPYFVVWAILMIVTDVLTIMYLGPGWEPKEKLVSQPGEMTTTTSPPFGTTTTSPPFGTTTTQAPGTSSALRSSRVSESKSASTLVSEIDPADWRRKWILSFAWLKLVIFALMFFLSIGTITLVPMFNILLGIWIFYNVMVILALGPTFSYDETKPYLVDEWKRKFILLVCWFSIAVVAVSFISYLSPSVYGPQRKLKMWDRPTLDVPFMRRPVYGPENRPMGYATPRPVSSRALVRTNPGGINF
jgi:hypothetical protein